MESSAGEPVVAHVLRRQPSFCVSKTPRPIRQVLPVFLEADPDRHYSPLKSLDASWIGQYRRREARQLVYVTRLHDVILSDIRQLSQLSHTNLARPVAVYSHYNQSHIAVEFIDFALTDITPLTEIEISSAMKQVLTATIYLERKNISFRFDLARVDLGGTVKMTLDYNHGPLTGLASGEHEPEVAAFLERTMSAVGPKMQDWGPRASHFLARLQAGHIPTLKVGTF
ncbi:uncharacterized protein F5Z01DRAFT_667647 [Emericellopsis atlantica]|uniref:Uncharacterized protein n=1 Tax=Emericellopsis atlantica TaxID=2614577 RepID=A0A9P7ZDC0_9HYPO|nr:uncharacterized protein F5Z01DRAFT_667647 [Emericellopsis atlantica]KAG9249969.1 hypothetical protein F5Z01DRAFT_667647 [Emericellopsis atlantica]